MSTVGRERKNAHPFRGSVSLFRSRNVIFKNARKILLKHPALVTTREQDWEEGREAPS